MKFDEWLSKNKRTLTNVCVDFFRLSWGNSIHWIVVDGKLLPVWKKDPTCMLWGIIQAYRCNMVINCHSEFKSQRTKLSIYFFSLSHLLNCYTVGT